MTEQKLINTRFEMPEELNKQLKVYKAVNSKESIQESILEILNKWFKEKNE